MTFFVCFNLLLGFLILEIEYYILYSDSDSKLAEAIQNLRELEEKLSKQTKERLEQIKNSKSSADKKANEDFEAEKKERVKQDSGNVVNVGSEPTPLTDLDGGD